MSLPTRRSLRNAVPSPVGGWVFAIGIVLLGSGTQILLTRAQAQPADSLNLIPRYRMARYQLLAQQFVREMPMRVLPPESIPVPADSLLAPSAGADTLVAEEKTDEPTFPVDDLRRVRRLEHSWFQNRYGDTEWAFLGAGTQLTFLDTTRTWALRARLKSRFGPPTHTPAEVPLDQWREQPDSTRDDLVQFAYWFVVNDSIPVRVTDVNGPTERGLIVSTDRRYRDRLVALRSALLGALHRKERAQYVDYYYDDAARRWYRTGFDGRSFFRERISRRDVIPGRRPRLDSDRTSGPRDVSEGSP